MNIKSFLDKHMQVKAPSYRGAPYPEFDPDYINESRFDDELRYKEVYFDWTQPDTLTITWEAQGYVDNPSSLLEEIRRWLENAHEKTDPTQPTVFISLVLSNREGTMDDVFIIEEDNTTYVEQE